jgi:putative oxidoreductase
MPAHIVKNPESEMDWAVKQPRDLATVSGTVRLVRSGIGLLNEYARPMLDLGVRIFVGMMFFKAGLTKISNWNATLYLFDNEYHVPLLSPIVAAYMGTAAELVLPVLLIIGLGARFAAAALFIFNVVAVVSYPDLGVVGLKDHQYWGLLLLVTLTHGPGKLALDHWIAKKLFFN